MSEYQYYEFQAVDRPLDDRQMRELSYWTFFKYHKRLYQFDHSCGSTQCRTSQTGSGNSRHDS